MLSPEQFAELIALIQTTTHDGERSEVRRAQRIAHPCRIAITTGTKDNEGPEFHVQLKDISARGISFLHNQEVARGSSLVLKLEGPDGKSASILSNVVHCRRMDEHTLQIGAEFTCVLGAPTGPAYEPSPEDLIRIKTSILN